jgi:hypothetical protein
VNYAKLLEMNSFFTLHSFLEVGKTQDLPSKFWQTLGDALRACLAELQLCKNNSGVVDQRNSTVEQLHRGSEIQKIVWYSYRFRTIPMTFRVRVSGE